MDGIGFQAGAGWCVGYPMTSSFEASVLRVRSYWRQKLAFSLGAELAHGHVAGWRQEGNIYAVLPLVEILVPQIGLAFFGTTEPMIPYRGSVQHLTPLVKLVSGVSVVNLSPDNPLLLSVIRSELSLELNRILRVQFTHRWLPLKLGYRWIPSGFPWRHYSRASICFTTRKDKIRSDKKDE